ncbi:MAG: 30S ribosomal protein S24e [Candidatus Bathyarchaeia archaeon]|nr:30S ribosomal protein S24e [Candidatus Bathyarchaeota archaeon]
MKISVISNKRNELLKRNEVIFSISHNGSPTPSRIEVRREIARILKVDAERVYIRKIESVTGAAASIGEAHIYDSQDQAKIIEPEHIIRRNTQQNKGG